MKTLQDMGKEVARLRKERELTQQQLGDLVGMGQSTIARFESGRVPEFGASKLLRILAALGHELVAAPLVIQETQKAEASEDAAAAPSEAPAKPRGRGRPAGSKQVELGTSGLEGKARTLRRTVAKAVELETG